jgi:hypothetical protein
MAEGVAALSARYSHYAEVIAGWKDRCGEMFSGAIGETTSAIARLDGRGLPMVRPFQRAGRDHTGGAGHASRLERAARHRGVRRGDERKAGPGDLRRGPCAART